MDNNSKRMEQEPVAVINGARKPVLYGDQSALDIGTPLYAAPQLPQPAVPDEMLAAMEEVLRISDRDHVAWHRAREGIAACRAAMLQGAEPAQGWIPCSERMPEAHQPCLVWVKEEGIYTDWGGSDENFANYHRSDVTHWMPLPAAPQQETK